MSKDKQARTQASADNASGKRHRRRRRAIIWTSVVIVLLAGLFFAIIYGISPVTKWYVEKNCKELTGRLIRMEGLDIDLLSGKVSIDDIVMYEQDDTTNFVRIGHFDMAVELGELFDDHILVKHAHIVRPDIRLTQNGERFNFDDLLEFVVETYLTGESDSDTEWRITLNDISVEEGHLAYYDAEIGQTWDLSAMNLLSNSVVLGDTATWVDASMVINGRAPVEGRLSYNYDNGDFTFEGAVSDFDLADTYKYWTPYLNIRSVAGVAAADVSAEGNVFDIMAMNIKGAAEVEGFAITDSRGAELVACSSVKADMADVNIDRERFVFNSLRASGYRAQYCMFADGTTNVDPLFYDDPKIEVSTTEHAVAADAALYDVREQVSLNSTATSAPLFGNLVFKVADLDMRGGRIYYEDNQMHKPFSYTLRNVEVKSSNFDIAAVNTVSLKASLQKQGTAMIRWQGSLNDFHNQNLLSVLTNVDMNDFTPYCEHYTAFPITDGNLTFRSQNIIVNGYLKGVNHLDTYNFTVGKKDKSLTPEFKIPLKLGVFILTDRKKHINIDLPVTGSIDSPEFSYRKIIMKGIGNLMLKVVSAPFAWLSSGKQDAFKYVDIDALAMGFDSEQYSRFDRMAEELKQEGDMKVRVVQRINYAKAVKRLAQIDMKIAYYNSTQAEPGHRLDMLDFDRIAEMKLSSRQVAEFADSQLVVKGVDPRHMSADEKAMALYGEHVDGQLQRIIDARNKAIAEYMAFQHADMPAGAFTVNTVTVDDVRHYTGKDRYTVTIIVDDEEVDVDSEDDADSADEDDDAAATVEDTGLAEDDAMSEDNTGLVEDAVAVPADTDEVDAATFVPADDTGISAGDTDISAGDAALADSPEQADPAVAADPAEPVDPADAPATDDSVIAGL